MPKITISRLHNQYSSGLHPGVNSDMFHFSIWDHSCREAWLLYCFTFPPASKTYRGKLKQADLTTHSSFCLHVLPFPQWRQHVSRVLGGVTIMIKAAGTKHKQEVFFILNRCLFNLLTTTLQKIWNLQTVSPSSALLQSVAIATLHTHHHTAGCVSSSGQTCQLSWLWVSQQNELNK